MSMDWARLTRHRADGDAWRYTLLVTTALLCVTVLVPGIATAQSAPSVTESRSFSIRPQALASALVQFSNATGIQLFFSADIVRGKNSPGASGRLSNDGAIAALLSGSGLSYRYSGDAVVITASGGGAGPGATNDGSTVLQPITVQGTGALPPEYPGGQVAKGSRLGILGNRDIMDTPFNVTSYTSKTIENQQSRSVADVTKNDPSVRSTWADGSYSNQFFVRGFPLANPDISVGGLYGLVPFQMSGTSWVERVEVLKGPSSLLNGMPPQGSIGGAINLVPKRATDEPLTRVTGSYISQGQLGTKVDIGRRFGDAGEFGVRVNGGFMKGDAPVDGQANELGEGSIGLDYRGDRVRLSADLVYQKNYSDNPARPIFLNTGVQAPRAPDASSDLGQDWYYSDGKDVLGIVRGEADITDDITAYASLGARHNDFLGLYNFSYIQNSAGDFEARNFYQPTYNDSVTGEVGVRASFETGAVRHELNVGFTGLYNELGALSQSVLTYSSNLYDPVAAAKPDLSAFKSKAPKTSASTLTSFVITDSLYLLDDRLQLILGARHQNVRQKAWNPTTGLQTADYDQSAITPAVGVVVKPWENVSFYANYIEGLSQGPIAPGAATNHDEAFPPIKSKQYEAGVKVDFGTISATASLFQIEQPSGFINAGVYGLNGEVRNRGLELNVFGEVADDVRLLGGVTFMDGVQTKTAGGVLDGKKAVGVPDVQLNLGAEWDTPFAEGLTLTGRVIHTASQYASANNTQSIPDWTRFDLGARYEYVRENGKPITVRASVENVFDKSYWAAASSNFGLARGAPRTFLVSTSFDF